MFAEIQTKIVNEKATAHEMAESGEDTSLEKGAKYADPKTGYVVDQLAFTCVRRPLVCSSAIGRISHLLLPSSANKITGVSSAYSMIRLVASIFFFFSICLKTSIFIVIVRQQVCILRVLDVGVSVSIRHLCVCVTSTIITSFLEIASSFPAIQCDRLSCLTLCLSFNIVADPSRKFPDCPRRISFSCHS